MQTHSWQVGDQIRVERPLYNHVGLYVGPRAFDPRDVIHNDKGRGMILSTLAEFSGGSLVLLHKQAPGNYFQRQAIAQSAFSSLGRKFDLLTFNCEHAANMAQSGKAESPQLQGFVLLALLFGGLALASGKS